MPYVVNETGLQEIHDILGMWHRLGYDHFDRAMLEAWAADVEQSVDNGNSPSFEIRAHDCVAKHAMDFTISGHGLTYVED